MLPREWGDNKNGPKREEDSGVPIYRSSDNVYALFLRQRVEGRTKHVPICDATSERVEVFHEHASTNATGGVDILLKELGGGREGEYELAIGFVHVSGCVCRGTGIGGRGGIGGAWREVVPEESLRPEAAGADREETMARWNERDVAKEDK